jgi:hypothetical protein
MLVTILFLILLLFISSLKVKYASIYFIDRFLIFLSYGLVCSYSFIHIANLFGLTIDTNHFLLFSFLLGGVFILTNINNHFVRFRFKNVLIALSLLLFSILISYYYFDYGFSYKIFNTDHIAHMDMSSKYSKDFLIPLNTSFRYPFFAAFFVGNLINIFHDCSIIYVYQNSTVFFLLLIILTQYQILVRSNRNLIANYIILTILLSSFHLLIAIYFGFSSLIIGIFYFYNYILSILILKERKSTFNHFSVIVNFIGISISYYLFSPLAIIVYLLKDFPKDFYIIEIRHLFKKIFNKSIMTLFIFFFFVFVYRPSDNVFSINNYFKGLLIGSKSASSHLVTEGYTFKDYSYFYLFLFLIFYSFKISKKLKSIYVIIFIFFSFVSYLSVLNYISDYYYSKFFFMVIPLVYTSAIFLLSKLNQILHIIFISSFIVLLSLFLFFLYFSHNFNYNGKYLIYPSYIPKILLSNYDFYNLEPSLSESDDKMIHFLSSNSIKYLNQLDHSIPMVGAVHSLYYYSRVGFINIHFVQQKNSYDYWKAYYSGFIKQNDFFSGRFNYILVVNRNGDSIHFLSLLKKNGYHFHKRFGNNILMEKNY